MTRSKLKPDQDLGFIQQELIDTIVEEYKNNTSLKGTAKLSECLLLKFARR